MEGPPAPAEQEHDFGRVKHGVILKHTFRIVNTSKVPLRITSVRSSNGCITASANRRVLQPGQTGQVELSVDTGRFVGPKAMSLVVEASGQGNVEQIGFTIKVDSVKGE